MSTTIVEKLINDMIQKTIPNYLGYINSSLEHFIKEKVFFTILGQIEIDNFRTLILLIFQQRIIKHEHSLWTNFLKAGMGYFNEIYSGLHVWPELFKIRIQLYNPHQLQDEDMHQFYLKITQNYIKKLEEYKNDYNRKIKDIILQFNNPSIDIFALIKEFIQDKIRYLLFDYRYKLTLINYDCEEKRLYREIYNQLHQEQKLNDQDLQIINNACQRTYYYETFKSDYDLYKELLKQKSLPTSFDTNHLPLSLYLKSINDDKIRQLYIYRHQQIINDYKSKLMIFLLDIMRINMLEAEKALKYEKFQLQKRQHSLPIKKRLNPIVLNLIDQRFNNMMRKGKSSSQYFMNVLFGKKFI